MKKMFYFFITAYPYVCVLVPCMLCQIYMAKKGGSRVRPAHLIWTYIFLIYISMVFSVTGSGSIWDFGAFGNLIRADEINLIPFAGGVGFGQVMNAFMFMPFGFLVPFIWTERRSLLRVVAVGACLSTAIELCQLFNRRVTDVEDVIMNTLGTIAGYAVWAALCRITGEKNREKQSTRTVALAHNEMEIYLVLALLGRFLLYNWRVLLQWY